MHAQMSVNELNGTAVAEWIRSHADIGDSEPKDYFRLKFKGRHGDITIYLSPFQLDRVALVLRQAEEDRARTLEEEAAQRKELEDAQIGG